MLSNNESTLVQFSDAPLEIIDGDRGKSYPKQADFLDKGYCLFLNAGNVTKTGFNFESCSFIDKVKDCELRKGKLQREDIVLTTRGTVGNVAYYDNNVPFANMRINSGMVIIRVKKDELDPKYLYSYLRSKLFEDQVKGLTTGSAQPQLPIRDIQRINLPLFPVRQQKYIANVIGNLDRKIELNNQINETLEAMAKAIFKEWFVDFGPVKAKAEGKKPFGMDDETAALFPDSFEDSELGLIPKGWGVASITELFDINPKYSLKKGNTYPYTEMKDLPTNSLSISSYIEREFTSGSKFSNGDTLVARITPCLENGKTAFVDYLPDNAVGWGSTEFIIIRSKAEIPLLASYLLARLDEFRNHLILNMSGTSGRQRVPESCLEKFSIAKAPANIWQVFNKIVTPMFEQIRSNTIEVKNLSKIRDLLLPKLISGELSIEETSYD